MPMSAHSLLTERSSMPRLVEPAPDAAQWAFIQAAAMRAPDHMQLQPYEFVVYEGNKRLQLGQLFAQAAREAGQTELEISRCEVLPLRAPTVVVALLRFKNHDKVPRDEQVSTVACACHGMLQAAFAEGLGGIWRSGWLVDAASVRQAFNLAPGDTIIGFLYLGTPALPTPVKPAKDPQLVFRRAD